MPASILVRVRGEQAARGGRVAVPAAGDGAARAGGRAGGARAAGRHCGRRVGRLWGF